MHFNRRYAYHLGQQTMQNLNPDGAACGVPLGYDMLPRLLAAHAATPYTTAALGKVRVVSPNYVLVVRTL